MFFFSVYLLAEKNSVIRKGGRKVIRRKLLVLRFSEVAGRINLWISSLHPFLLELLMSLWAIWTVELLVGWDWFWNALMLFGGANSSLILFFQNARAVRRSVMPPRNLLHPRHLLSPDAGPRTSPGSTWAHSSMAQNLETTKGKWKYLVRRLSAGLISFVVLRSEKAGFMLLL